MNWTNEKPTKKGWYWWRKNKVAVICRVWEWWDKQELYTSFEGSSSVPVNKWRMGRSCGYADID